MSTPPGNFRISPVSFAHAILRHPRRRGRPRRTHGTAACARDPTRPRDPRKPAGLAASRGRTQRDARKPPPLARSLDRRSGQDGGRGRGACCTSVQCLVRSPALELRLASQPIARPWPASRVPPGWPPGDRDMYVTYPSPGISRFAFSGLARNSRGDGPAVGHARGCCWWWCGGAGAPVGGGWVWRWSRGAGRGRRSGLLAVVPRVRARW